MTIAELRNNANKLLQDAQAILLQANVTAEARANAHKMIADADALEADIKMLERVEANNRSANPVPRGGSNSEDVEVRNQRQREGFLSYLRTGRSSGEYRDLTTATTGEIIPQAFLPVLYEAQKSYGQILAEVGRKRTSNGNPLKIALVNDTANEAVTIAEGTTVSELDPAFTGIINNVDEINTGLVVVSLAEIQDSEFDLDSFIRKIFGIRGMRKLADAVTNGTASGNFVALTSAPVGATSASGVAIGYDDITALWGALDPAYLPNAKFAMSNLTRAYLLGIKDTLGRPLFIPNPSTGAFDKLLGHDVVLNQFLQPIAVNNVAVQFGDFAEGYLLRTAGDMSVIRMNERYIDKGYIGFTGYMRAGGNVLDAGTHPVLSLKQAAS